MVSTTLSKEASLPPRVYCQPAFSVPGPSLHNPTTCSLRAAVTIRGLPAGTLGYSMAQNWAHTGSERRLHTSKIFSLRKHWRRKWQPTPIFLPGKSNGQRSLAGYSPWGLKRVGHDLVTERARTQHWPRRRGQVGPPALWADAKPLMQGRDAHAPSASSVSFMTISTRSTWCRFQRPSRAARFWSRKGRIWATTCQGGRLQSCGLLLEPRGKPDPTEGPATSLSRSEETLSRATVPRCQAFTAQ